MEDGEGRADAEAAAAPGPPPPAGIASPRASNSSASSNEAADVPSAALPNLGKPADGIPAQVGRYDVYAHLLYMLVRMRTIIAVRYGMQVGISHKKKKGWYPPPREVLLKDEKRYIVFARTDVQSSTDPGIAVFH